MLSPEQINEVNEVITDNFLIVAGQEELWSDAFRYFAQGHNYRYRLEVNLTWNWRVVCRQLISPIV